MKNRITFILAIARIFLLSSLFLPIHAEKRDAANPFSHPSDSLRSIPIREAIITASPKESDKLRQQPLSSTTRTQEDLRLSSISSIKNLSANVPNLFIPEYGSRLTSAIYVRGIGSRIGSPAISMYVDNLPVSNISAYDIDLLDIEHIDVLRGPQGTLYGRGSMGGLLRVFTRDPIQWQGNNLHIGGSMPNGEREASFSSSWKWNDQAATSVLGYYNGERGAFRNHLTGEKTGKTDGAGGKIRTVWKPSKKLRLDGHLSYSFHEQTGYPYRYTGTLERDEEEPFPEDIGHISSNRESHYRRHLFQAGLNVEYKQRTYSLHSLTGYQYLCDNMGMDQDFMPLDLYVLQQRQRENNWSQELILKTKAGKWLQQTSGIYLNLSDLHTSAPVTFFSDGMTMLNEMLASAIPPLTMSSPLTGTATTMPMSLRLTDTSLHLGGTFQSPTQNYAFFHQSVLHDVALSGLDITLGCRLEYERLALHSRANSSHAEASFSMPMIPAYTFRSTPSIQGSLHKGYWQCLPKVALSYNLNRGKGFLYASVAKGYRSGGYNVQLFSDLLQQSLQGAMMESVRDHANALLDRQIAAAASETMRTMFSGIKQMMNDKMPVVQHPDLHSLHYKPEECWSHELGAHLSPTKGMQSDISLFFISTKGQQIARYAESGMGRGMVNAGRSRSYGAEVAIKGRLLSNRLFCSADYGYTHATFSHYYDGRNSYRGKYVPLMPRHSLHLAARYVLPLKGDNAALSFGGDMTAWGRVYWTESNDVYQNLRASLGLYTELSIKSLRILIWGKNLTQSRHDTFYFESMKRGFAQRCLPARVGIDLDFSL